MFESIGFLLEVWKTTSRVLVVGMFTFHLICFNCTKKFHLISFHCTNSICSFLIDIKLLRTDSLGLTNLSHWRRYEHRLVQTLIHSNQCLALDFQPCAACTSRKLTPCCRCVESQLGTDVTLSHERPFTTPFSAR